MNLSEKRFGYVGWIYHTLDVACIICLRVSEKLCAQRGDGFWDGEDGRDREGRAMLHDKTTRKVNGH